MCIHTFKPLATGFHSHGHMSLDGGSTGRDKVKYAQLIGRKADCLTDHGIVSGLAEHWKAAADLSKKGPEIKSIHGIEAYVIDENRPMIPMRKGSKVLIHQYYHLTIHFKTQEAYQYFCRLTEQAENRAVVKYGERKPLMYFKELLPMSGQITLGSGCLGGPVQKNVMLGQFAQAEDMYVMLRNIAGPENFYVEVFPHIIDHDFKSSVVDNKTKRIIEPGYFEKITSLREWEGEPGGEPEINPCTGTLDIQKIPNQFVIEMAKKYGDRVVVSLDDHFGPKEDKLVQDARLGNGQSRWKFFGSYHAQTSEECFPTLEKQLGVGPKVMEEWIDNSYQFIEHFDDYKFLTSKDRQLLPTVTMVYGEKEAEKSTTDIFWEKVKKHGLMPKEDDPEYQVYMDRIERELKVMTKNKAGLDFLPYFFLLEDMCDYARRLDINYTSRGSAGGSLVLFLLNIVITNPIKYGLSFERFLNPGRIDGGDLPDVDLDWENRHLILKYAKEKYGDQYALIASDGKLLLKSSIKDAERALKGRVSDEAESLSKKLNVPLNVRDQKKWLFEGEGDEPAFWDSEDPVAEELRNYAEKNPDVWDMVLRCIGITRQRGVHAGGIIITPGPVSDYIPLIKTSEKGKKEEDKDFATAFDMHGVEYVGGVKFDLLGLTTLDALGIARRAIKKDLDIDIPWGEFPDDIEVYRSTVAKNLMQGVFQLNTNVALPYVKKIQPQNVVQYAALTSLCRPGSLDAPSPDPADAEQGITAAKYYVACAMGERDPYYIHEDLRDILEETHGVIVYQEQAMQIGAKFAGYSEGEADMIIRKGIGKKIQEKIQKFSDDLMARLPDQGWTKEQVNMLVASVQATANYSFNKSHAISYAIVAWNCCWLKHHYEPYYWKGMLSAPWSKKEDKVRGFMKECGDKIKPVDVRMSGCSEWRIEKGGFLRTPMDMIKGCGEKGVVALERFMSEIPGRESLDWQRFIQELKVGKKESRTKGMTVSCITNLLFSGAFDGFLEAPPAMGVQVETYTKMFEEVRDALKSKAKLPSPPKGKTVGVSTLTSDFDLGIWRHMVNPLAHSDFLQSEEIVEKLKMVGFCENNMINEQFNYDFPFKYDASNGDRYSVNTGLIRDWDRLFSEDYQTLYKSVQDKRFNIAALGVITGTRMVPYLDKKSGVTKEKMVIEIFNGHGLIEDITLWPSWETGTVDKSMAFAMKKGALGVMVIRPTKYNGRHSGSVSNWMEIRF